MKIDVLDLDWKKRQLMLEIENEKSLYLQSLIARVLFDIIQNKKIPYFERLTEIYLHVNELKEPNNSNYFRLDYPENLDILKEYYKEVIKIIDEIIEKQ